MYKLVPFEIKSHRLFKNTQLSDEIQEIGKAIKPTNESFANLLIASVHEPKLELLLKAMLDKKGKKYFLDLNYQLRLTQEINVILNHEEDFILDFFLIHEDIAHWFEQRGEISGIGRGAAVGSLINYLLNITKIDPVEHNLLFSRWMSTHSTPLLDVDVPRNSLPELKDYLKTKYGSYCQEIRVKHFWKIKTAINTVLRNHGYTSVELMKELSLIVSQFEHMRLGPTLLNEQLRDEKSYFKYLKQVNNNFKNFFNANPVMEEEILELLGTVKEIRPHVSGLVIANTYEVDFENVEKEGIVKFNFLTLLAYDNVNKYNLPKDVANFNFNPKRLARQLDLKARAGNNGTMMSSLEFYEKHLSHKFAISSLPDLAKVIAYSRMNVLMLDKLNKCPVNDLRLTAELTETDNELIYQEQVMKIISNCLNIDLNKARQVLKEVSNNSPRYQEQKDNYIMITGDNGEVIWNYLETVTPYCFLKAHALAYAYVDYLSIPQ